ncbi:MAG: SAM-dependent DNA methyltransferase [Phycisphaerae bacterium]|nr:SAM-dependent DNA methyltransferase [Phycisphaerae bacterium]
MTTQSKPGKTTEFGDLQTPMALAQSVCRLLAQQGTRPASIVEPTCGIGNFLLSALSEFTDASRAIGVEINPEYVRLATTAVGTRQHESRTRIIRQSFFETDWRTLLAELPEPLLVVGNPPWVTNAELGTIGSSNVPSKTNFQNLNGLDAITGKSNFDISEWMLLKILGELTGRRATMAMLCKTAVARKVLLQAWNAGFQIESSSIHLIEASEHFGASVDACLLVCHLSPSAQPRDCPVYKQIHATEADRVVGFRDEQLIADVCLYDRWKHLTGFRGHRWRSGIKHDCARVMEFRRIGNRLLNGFGELADLEDDYLFPMLKSSDLANGHVNDPRRWMLVTQQSVGDDTGDIERRAPRTWRYLQQHSRSLDRRASAIYKKRPRFSVFGVGPYSFSPWKVAISGFYKKLEFKTVTMFRGKPIVLDDTSYLIPCKTGDEADYIASLLNSQVAREFFLAFVFWDAKRPITSELLNRLDLLALARELGSGIRMTRYLSTILDRDKKAPEPCEQQGKLFFSRE